MRITIVFILFHDREIKTVPRKNIDIDYDVLMEFAHALRRAATQMEEAAFDFKRTGREGSLSVGNHARIKSGLAQVPEFLYELRGKLQKRQPQDSPLQEPLP